MDEQTSETCWLCLGTGIGQHGDINTSRCPVCHGTGDAPETFLDRMERADIEYDLRRDLEDREEERKC